MKIRRFVKRAVAYVLAAIMTLSIAPIQTVLAAVGDVGSIVFDYTYDSAGNPMRYNGSAIIDGFTAGGTGQYKFRMFVDGDTAFCLEPGVPLHTGDTLVESSSEAWDSLTTEQQKAVGLALLYGYQGNRANLPGSDDEIWLGTQTLVWEFVTGCRNATGDFAQTSQTVYQLHFGSNYPNEGARVAYENIVSLLQEHHTIPSFLSTDPSAITKSLSYEDGQYVLTLTDSNGVMEHFSFSSSDPSVELSASGNTLTIRSAKPVDGTVRIEAVRNNVPTVSESAKLLAYGSPTLQDVITGVENADRIAGYMNIETPVGSLKLVKTSEDGNVSGISFTITGPDFSRTVTTGEDGTIAIDELQPGTYTVTEASANKYEPQESQQVTIVGGQTATVTFNNTLKRGSLEVVKSSEDNFVEGVTFHLYGTSLSGDEVDVYAVTDENGVARFDDVLVSGDTPYVLEEVDTAIRYVVPEAQNVSIQWDEVAERSFYNALKKFTVTVTKMDAETGDPQGDATLAGAKYGIYKGGELVDTYVTDENGQFTTKEYVCDMDWTVQEIEPSEGYLLDTTVHEVGADPGQYTIEHNTTANSVTEQVIKGNIRLIKHIDAELEETEDASQETASEPAASIAEKETSLVQLAAVQPESVAEAPDNEVQVHSDVQQETDSTADESDTLPEQSETNSDVSADGAEENETNASETKAVEDSEETLPSATESETVQETESTAEETQETESAESEESQMETEDEYAPVPVDPDDLEASGGSGVIEQPEEGAKFQIYLASAGSYDAAKESERDILITDSDGIAVSKDLPYGLYRVHQVEGMEGQAFVDDFTVYIHEDGQTYSYIINNQSINSLIRVEKRDAETGNIIPAAGIGFQIRDLSTGELVSQTVYYPSPVTITTFYTDDSGTLMLPAELPYGEYELIEVETCYGYILDSEPVPFTVDGSSDVVTVTKYNYAQKGKIHIEKTGEIFASVSEKGLYQPIYEEAGLEGATYTITASEDIVTLDGTVRYQAGEVVDTITTGSDGVATSKELYLGQYVVTEIEAPDGMVLNSEPQTVELTYAGQEVSLTETSVGFYNERQHVAISLEKTLETDDIFGIGQNGEILSVRFGLYAAETLTAADGSEIPADGMLEIVNVSEDGTARFTSDLPFGSYYLKEYATDAHYLISDATYPVTFEYAGQDIPVVEIAANDGEAIANELKYGSVSGKKLDEDGNALEGALIGLFTTDTTEFTEENALMTVTSGEDGLFQFEQVPVGDWIVREIRQPEGYVLCEELFPVTITEDAQVIEIEIINEWVRGNLTLTKYDADYPENKLTGAVFEVYRDTNNDETWGDGDELIGTMEETSEGIYWMQDLKYGGYFVREKTAPEGFVLDENAYYTFIDTDGATYEIENEAGKGFLNQAQRGSLKIVKTTDDGKVEGFAFRVTGAGGYEETFTTDANGEIFIENLRIGEYVITEMENEASKGYKIADPVTVTLVADETLTVNVHNDKITVDVPKTGDDTNLALWIGLMALGVTGVGVTGLVYLKGKKSKKAKNNVQ